jgi:ubiquitin carboxyl-terminal hydrolase MINDY-1/2
MNIRTFLDNTSSQLTYHGLFDLSSSVQSGQLVALFRNSHLSVLYKPPSADVHPHFASHNPFADKAAAEADATHPVEPAPAGDQSPEPHFASHNPFGAKASAEYERRHPHPHADTNTLYTLVTDAAFVREPTVVWEALRDIDGQTAAFVDAHFTPSAPAGGDFSGALADEMAALAVVDDHECVPSMQGRTKLTRFAASRSPASSRRRRIGGRKRRMRVDSRRVRMGSSRHRRTVRRRR